MRKSLKALSYLAIFIALISTQSLYAQLTGVKTIPGTYASVSAAITDLNTQGVGAGGVTFNVAAGYTETAPAGGFSITTLTGSASNPIVFQKSGAGANPTFTASAVLSAGSLTDGIFKIIGADYVTINGFTMQENAANLVTVEATNNMTEWGVALLYASATDGASNNTITNCTISLGATYQNAFGIYSNVRHTATAPTVTADITAPSGSNSNNTFSLNSISNVNIGICIVGSTTGANMDTGLSISQTSVTFGLASTFSAFVSVNQSVNGIYLNNQLSFSINLSPMSSRVGGITGTGTVRGIYAQTTGTLPVTGSYSRSITNCSIGLTGGNAANILVGIANEGGSNIMTLTINNNFFTGMNYSVAGTGAVTMISNTGATLSQDISNNVFSNLSINTTGAVNFVVNAVLVSATGSMTMNNNSIATAFTKTLAGNAVTFFTSNASSVTGAVVSMSNNNFSNITLTGATGFTGINNTDGASASSGPVKTINGNTFSNISGGTGTMNIMTINFSGPNSSVSNNTISNISWGAAVTALTLGTSNQTGFSIASNNINTISTTAGAVIGISNGVPSVSTVSLNTINTLSSTAAVAVTGMTSSSTTPSIFKNKIYDILANNASGSAFGLTISGGTTVTAYNNLIGDIRAPLTNAANGLVGLNVTGGTTVNLYNNTVWLNATSSGAVFGSSAMSISSTPTVTLRNNILFNTSTPNTTGFTVAYRRSSTTLTSYAAASNNNDFYAGTPGASRLLFYDGTNSDQNITALKARMSPRDGVSISESPTFRSTTGSNANFLKIDSTVATQLESGAQTISSPAITDDYYGIQRFPNAGYPNNLSNPATAPDIGANEFGGIPLDLNPPVISYTNLSNTGSVGNRILTATITDLSGVPVAGSFQPRIYYKKNAGSYFNSQGSFQTGTGKNGTWNFTIIASDMGGVAQGDVVSYFVIAQDIAPAGPFISSNPSAGLVASDVNTVTTPPTTPNTYTIAAAPMSGTYTVGTALFNRVTGKNIYFEERTRTVTKTVAVYNDAVIQKTEKSPENSGMNAPKGEQRGTQEVTSQERYSVLMENGREYTGELSHAFTSVERAGLNLSPDMAGVYLTITAAVADVNLRGVNGNTILSLTDATYPGETYPIVFNNTSESAPSASATITMKPANGVATSITGSLDNNALVRILGSYVIIDGSNNGSSSQDLTITNTSVTGPNVLLVGSTGTTYITGVTVKNSILINGVNTSSCLIVSDATAIGTAGYFTNIYLYNNYIQKAYVGIFAIANTASVSNVTAEANNMSGSGANAIRFCGVYMQGVNGAVAKQNYFAFFDGTSSEDDRGVWFATGTINSTADGNRAQNLNYSGTGGYGTYGVAVSSGTAACNDTVRNNGATALSGDGWVNTTLGDNTHGIYLFGVQTGVKVYNNSIYLSGNTLNQTGAMSYGITLATGTTADVRNNAIVNNLGLLAGVGLGSTCIYLQTDATQLENGNNNVYFCNPTGSGVKDIGKINATDYTTLAAWQTVTGKEQNSLNGDPAFFSTTSNVPDGTNPNSWIVNGTGYPGLSLKSLNGVNRSASIATGPCDIGAYEFTPSVPPPAATQTGTIGAGNTTTYSIFGRQFASITWGAAGTYPGSLTATFNSGTPPPAIPGGARYGFGYWEFIPDVQPSGGATYSMTIKFDDGQTGTINTPATNLILAKYNGSAWTDYQPGAGTGQSNLNYAGKTVTVAGLTSFSIFALTDFAAPLPVELASFTSSIDHRNVSLNWSTNNEQNNVGFDVERKLTSSAAWSKVGFVAGAGNSNVTKAYTFNERNLATGNYSYRLKQMDVNGNFHYYDLSNEVIIGIPTKFDLSQNYPNPFNPTTKINFDLPFDSKVQIVLFDMTGRQVATILNANQSAGYQTVSFNASNLSSGAYFYQINATGGSQSFSKTMKMMLVK